MLPLYHMLGYRKWNKKDCKEASEVTMTYRGLSRGFTGQTEEWFLEWLSQDGDYAQNRTVFIERDAEGKIKGLVED